MSELSNSIKLDQQSWNRKRMYVVTGGAGFIGSNLVAALEKSGRHKIAICDRFGSDEKWRNVAKRALTEIIAPETLLTYLEDNANRIEAIFHMGAISATTETDVDLIIQNNFRLSCDIWKICCIRKLPLIYASSAATYGDGSGGFADDFNPDCLSKLQPLNAYGWSKHLFDRWISSLLQDSGISSAPPQWAGLKFFNVYGPNEYHKGTMISVALKNFLEIKAGGPAVLFRSHKPGIDHGNQMRDFIWVGDCVKVMLWLLNHSGTNGIFNLGTGKAQSFLELANAVFRAMGLKSEIRFVDTPTSIRDKYQYFTQADIRKLRAAGYNEPFVDVKIGVQKYVQKFLLSEDPYR
jgi:ADP-L-glycero-D-manno-heptose 6-epimerase